MKKLLFAVAFLLLNALPSQASPQAEACLNKTITQTESSVSSAQLVASIEHDGSQYHYIEGASSNPRIPDARIFLRTDHQGGCEEIMSYLVGSAPSEKVFRERLGSEVFLKLQQQAKASKSN
ncbi:hypothetical protein [Acaryochloris marina]|uniref:hypothetical protein n=1 Tax=Acaryochloris marina TaxID=155978 RepID=UPI00059FB7F1|nr:hypothetical protein [Acaryochloris marina]